MLFRSIGSGDFPPGNTFGLTTANTIIDVDFQAGYNLTYKMDPSVPFNYTPDSTIIKAGTYHVTVIQCFSIPIGNLLDGYCSTLESERLMQTNNTYNDSIIVPWLGNAFPNPFNNYTEIPYYLPTNTTSAEIDIFDIIGNKIVVYPLSIKGRNTNLEVNSINYSSGVYFCTLVVDGNKAGWKKLVIIK